MQKQSKHITVERAGLPYTKLTHGYESPHIIP